MLQFEELRLRLLESEDSVNDLADALGLDKMKEEVNELETQSAAPGFWDDLENPQKVLQRTSALKNRIASYEALKSAYDDALMMVELANEEEDLSLLDECTGQIEAVEAELEKQRSEGVV